MRRRLLIVLTAGALLLTACGSDDAGPLLKDDSSQDTPDFSYVIPAGAGELIDQGEPLDILPREIGAQVGELFELINLDDRGHLVGPFFVGAGETLRQRFSAPGTFIGACSVHPSGEIVLTVVE
ncbi:MAG: hypothetical protein QNL12_12285 [Acidimicrobiia bacterium]|nr:hypothetical protein [Acidimicrobiia bacterium]MDX2468087.1 hypothetical protein [Acidimicrobiia bacterium]